MAYAVPIMYIYIYVLVSKFFHETVVVYFINVKFEFFLCMVDNSLSYQDF